MTCRRHRDEHGAVSMLFAVLLGTGVLFGLVALTFDFGNINANHSQLQASADAAALQAAKTCVTTGTCPALGDLLAISQANDSGSAHSSQVAHICGDAPEVTNPPVSCAYNDDNLISHCPETPDWVTSSGVSFVQTYTQKQTDSTFANAGNGGDTLTGGACASVAWGKIKDYTASLPLTFSYCEWKAATGGDPLAGTGDYASNPPTGSDTLSVIYLNKPATADGSCPTWQGHDAPGGFGWLDAGGDCSGLVSVGSWVQVDTGNNTTNSCKALLPTILHKVINIPVFDCQNRTATYPTPLSVCVTGGNGSNHFYHIVGFASFYLTGWHLSGTSGGAEACSGGQRCLSGYFVKSVAPGGEIDPGNGPGFGLDALQTIG